MENWQADTITQLIELLQPKDAVQAAILVGSLANPGVQPDQWSDIDIVVVVDDDEIAQFFPGFGWLAPIGAVYTFSQTQNSPFFTSRVCLTDTRRIDFIFLLESTFAKPVGWKPNPFQYGYRVLFSKSAGMEAALTGKLPVPKSTHDPDTEFEQIATDFWFKGMLAVSKVARNDLLIAQHLTLDLARYYLVVGMMLRDRELNTRHHRHGGFGNELIARLALGTPQSGRDILNSIVQISQIFDPLGFAWSENYQEKRFTLLDWVEIVSVELDAEKRE
jgi:hypothetical protein